MKSKNKTENENSIEESWEGANALGVFDPRPMASAMKDAPYCKNCGEVYGNNNFGAEHLCDHTGELTHNYEPCSDEMLNVLIPIDIVKKLVGNHDRETMRKNYKYFPLKIAHMVTRQFYRNAQRNSMTNQTPQWEEEFDNLGIYIEQINRDSSIPEIEKDMLAYYKLKNFVKEQIDKAYENGRAGRKTFEVHDCAEMFATEIEKARKETEKAFGGCTKCYGKGYGSNEIKLVTCKCSRGKDMQGILEKTWIEGCKEGEKTSVIFQVENERDRWAKEGAERENKGFKAGLQRAIDILPEAPTIQGIAFNYRNYAIEEIKKEMEK